jgi:ABC-type antimicrobial peptide transport system permease subunit
MEGWIKDLRYAGRGLFRTPGVSVIAVVALALGIGLTTIMFSIVYGALHRGLPFDGAERIMNVERANPSRDIAEMSVPIALGMVIGSGLAILVARGLAIVIYDAAPWDPGTYFIVFAVLALTGFLASFVPARRATRVHPMDALRYD